MTQARHFGGFWRIALLGLSVAMFVPATSAPASALGFFEALFGRRPSPPQPVFQPPPQYAPMYARPRQSVVRTLRPERPRANIARTKPASAAIRSGPARPPVLAGPLGPFLMDPTLRRGDVVVTSDGLKIFTGSSATQHAAGDFAGLPKVSGLAAGNSSVLASIEKANRLAPMPLEEAQIVPVVRATPAAAGKPKTAKQAALDIGADAPR